MPQVLLDKKSFIVNSFEQAKEAVKLNEGRELSIISAPGSALYYGPSYFISLKHELEKTYNSLKVKMWVDCGENPGLAMKTIRQGGKHIIFTEPNNYQIHEMATQENVEIIYSIPDIIDLSKN